MPVEYKFIIVVLFSVIKFSVFGQDLPMSQYYNNLVMTNPAYSGTTQKVRVSGMYRQQWIKVPGAFESYGVSFDMPIVKYNSGIGVVAHNSISGAVSTPAIELIYAYHVQTKRYFSISMALQGGVVQKYFRQSEMEFEDESEVILSGLNKIYPDFGIGAVVFFKNKLYGGFSIHHLNKPQTGSGRESSKLVMKYTGQIGYVVEFSKKLIKQKRILMPSALVQIHGNQQNITWGAVYQHDVFLGGLQMRHNIYSNIDVLIFSAGFKTPKLRFAYSYDMNVGKRATMPLGSHEVALTLLFETKAKKKYKAIRCPSFLE